MSDRLWQRLGAAKQGTFVFIVLAVTVLGLILMACGNPETVQAVPAGAKPGDLTAKPCTFKTDGAEYAADCGTLVVPENRAKADSRLIALPVIRVRATGNNPAEPIFWLTGGPGQNNMKLKPPAWLFARHDFVMVGYRGADGSSVLDQVDVQPMAQVRRNQVGEVTLQLLVVVAFQR